MSCSPVCSCGCGAPVLALVPPPPGETHLRRRVGEFHGFVEDLVAAVEQQEVDGRKLGTEWDIEADPAALRLVHLWAYVAETVAAYSELTAGEAYLPTAQDWTDLRRIAALVGFAPRPPIAAQGWVVADIESTTSPVVPAGTRVQAPAKPGGASQTFEVIADTALRAEWAGLTATWVPQPAIPDARSIRFIGDPGFRVADRVLFVLEEQASLPSPKVDWLEFWTYLFELVEFVWDFGSPATAQPLALTTVGATSAELGTTVVEFDRDLDKLLGESATAPYAAYRVLATASVARQITEVLRVPATGAASTVAVPTDPGAPSSISSDHKTIIVDRPLDDLSRDKLVAVVDWGSGSCDVVEVSAHSFTHWDVVPGTPTRVSKLEFANAVPTLSQSGPITVYVLDRRVVARHYVFPDTMPATSPPQLRLYPRPADAPERVAVASSSQPDADWEVFECDGNVPQETDDQGQPSGLIVDLPSGAPTGVAMPSPASGNLLRVHHGKTTSVVLGSGDASQAGQEFTTPDSPIAYDLDDSGKPVPSMLLRVDGLQWDEVPSLYAAGPADVFAVEREATGAETVSFGDGAQGARLTTGRGNVTATYRVGGGREGEVDSGAITTLLGSIRGVKKVRGAGQTEGGADQDAESDLRRLAPTRARAFGRAVSAEDLVDLALGYPGVTHASSWNGQGPPGCACGGSGLHLAFVRSGTSGPRAPLPAEIDQLSGYLDSVRDATVPLCVCAGVVTTPTLTVVLATDPRRDLNAVVAAVTAALVDPDGELGPDRRVLGQPLDRSDVFAVVHEVAGVVGVASLDLPGADTELGRLAAKVYELLVPSGNPSLTGAAA
ncbi:MAG TPA: baseplate J/gp47 family protein [Gaiellaceae bacterium]|nr:baseplate J/gp47 family protein [Gaiellaceae bacterium]